MNDRCYDCYNLGRTCPSCGSTPPKPGLVLDPINPLATKIQTRDGRPARLLAVDLKSIDGAPYAAVVTSVLHDEEYESVYQYFEDGRFRFLGDNPNDLINVPVKRTVWLNIEPDLGFGLHLRASSTRDGADIFANPSRIARLKIEFTEGQFDE